jgi:hypothetical protein
MKAELENLKITDKELEKITAFDVNEVFVGSVLGGVYRPLALRHPKKLLFFCLTEIFVSLLIFVFTLPIGLYLTKNSTNGIKELSGILQFLQITLAITLIVVISWNLYMWFKVKHLKTLIQLLDEIDRYHELLQAVDLLDRLEAVGNSQLNLINRKEVLEALKLARDSLVSGLITEKILRESRSLLSRRHDLIANIENNLVTLKTLEVNNQANQYGQLLNEAIQIGLSVHKEIQNLS